MTGSEPAVPSNISPESAVYWRKPSKKDDLGEVYAEARLASTAGGMILVCVEDLIFLSKILESAKRLGLATKTLAPPAVVQEVRQNPNSQVILDLNHRTGAAVDLVKSLKNDPATRHATILGFVSHVHADLIERAREAGCDRVVARSAFSGKLPQLLKELVGDGPSTTHE